MSKLFFFVKSQQERHLGKDYLGVDFRSKNFPIEV